MTSNVQTTYQTHALFQTLSLKENLSLDEKEFYTHLKAANDAFQNDRVPDFKVEKAKFIQDLEASYAKLYEIYKVNPKFIEKPENLSLVTRLFFLLGRYCYGAEMEKARYFLQAALLLKLLSLGWVKSDFLTQLMAYNSPQGFYENLAKEQDNFRSTFTDLPEKILANLSENQILDYEDKQQILEFSCILRWVGHACQNIDKLKTQKSRFDQVYGLCQKINDNVFFSSDAVISKEGNWETIDLRYNKDRFMYDLENPYQSPKERCLAKIKLVDELEPYLKIEGKSLRETIKRAQIENIKAFEKANIIDFKAESFQHMVKAVEIAEKTPDFDPFLKNMFDNNFVGLSMKIGKIDVDLINKINKTLEYIKDNQHFYNAIYINTAANLFFHSKQTDYALTLLDKAEEIANLSPENALDILASIRNSRNKFLAIQSLLVT